MHGSAVRSVVAESARTAAADNYMTCAAVAAAP